MRLIFSSTSLFHVWVHRKQLNSQKCLWIQVAVIGWLVETEGENLAFIFSYWWKATLVLHQNSTRASFLKGGSKVESETYSELLVLSSIKIHWFVLHFDGSFSTCGFITPCTGSTRVPAWSLSRVQFFATPWTVARQSPLSMEFPRQEHWSRLPFPTPGSQSSRLWDQTCVSCISCTDRQILYH